MSQIFNKIRRAIFMNTLVHREYLAHKLAYTSKDLLNNPIEDNQMIKIPAFDSIDGRMVDAKVHKIITGSESLVGFILEINDHINQPRVEIVWRGTHNMASAHMDLEKDGAGSESYAKAKEKIIAQINAVVENLSYKTGSRVVVGVSGHSLGGALAQHCLTDLAGAIVQNNLEDHKASNMPMTTEDSLLLNDLENMHGFHKDLRDHISLKTISRLELAAFNSTGVDQTTYDKAQLFSEYLQNPLRNTKNANGAKQPKFAINADYCLNSRDGVQQTGLTNILAECPFARVNLFKFDPAQNLLKKAAISSGVALLFSPVGGVLGSALAGVAMYKALSTVESHTTKHSSFTKEDYSLKLHSENYTVYSNKTLDQKEPDPIGAAKIKEQLLIRKNTILNHPVTNWFKQGLYYLAQPIIGEQKLEENQFEELVATKIASIKQQKFYA